MREADETTRQRILDALREDALTPSELGAAFDVPPPVAVDHVQHLARSLREAGEELLVRPPACHDCGFDGFDDPLNLPSRCPECKSERVAEPAFTVE
jgi:predicted Zn-ribbon and HTH transcriptional regulator